MARICLQNPALILHFSTKKQNNSSIHKMAPCANLSAAQYILCLHLTWQESLGWALVLPARAFKYNLFMKTTLWVIDSLQEWQLQSFQTQRQ